MANYKLVDNWTFRRKLPEPFDEYTDDPVCKGISSVHCTQPQKKATLHASSLRAILAYMELEAPIGSKKPEELGAIGSQGNDFTIAEYPSKTGELHVVIYNRNTGKFNAGRYSIPPDIESVPDPYVLKEKVQSGTALLFALIPTALADDEFNEYYQFLKKNRDSGYPDMDEAAQNAAILCDNLYRRLRYSVSLPSAGIKTAIPSNDMVANIKPFNIQKGLYAPTNIINGDFKVVKPGATKKASIETIKHEDFVGQFVLNPSHLLTPEEDLSVPQLDSWFIVPKEIKRICEHAKLTTNMVQPMRNFLLRGPAGTGKTEGARAIASGLHLPFRIITCSANTEIFDLLGQILPDVDGKLYELKTQYPSFTEITLDPTSAYEKLTGIYDESVACDVVYKKLIDTVCDEMHKHYADVTSKSDSKYRYIDTPLIEAIRYGYVLELQEPTVIANPGVLVGLNSILDRCNSVFLPTGETVQRHPDTVIVVTTNIEYAGCKALNQSFISRMSLVIDMEEPDEDTLVSRVLGITGCTDKVMVRTMARIVKSISEYCREQLISDGCCGVRELISWVQSYMICGDIREAANYTILSSVTADAESRTEIESSCLDTMLAA